MTVDVRSVGQTARTEPTIAEIWQLVAAGAFLVGGIFSDGWAHSNVIDRLDGFITPWHMVIFAGFLACLAAIAKASLRRVRLGAAIWSSAPTGWSSAVWGIGLFALGFLGDGIWHTIYGIEADFEALMSPTHLMMLTGALGVLAAPISSTPRRSGFSVAPALVAATLFVSLVSFFLVWIWPPDHGVATRGYQAFAARQADEVAGLLQSWGEVIGVAGYLLFTIAVVAPVLLLGRRWKLPVGAVLLLIVVPWLGLTVSFLGDGIERIPAIVVAAVVGEAILRFGDTDQRRTWLTFAAVVPAVWVAGDMVAIQLTWGIGWVPELVAGSVVMSALTGTAIGLLATADSR